VNDVEHKVEDTQAESIPQEWLKELAASGAICEVCAGVHIPDIDTALLALTAQRETGIEIPYCTCEECRVCEAFRTAVASLAREHQLREDTKA
jgi:hypothetical protein